MLAGFVMLAGAAGALARMWIGDRVRVPLGTFIVNGTGSLALGLTVAMASGDVRRVVGVGFLGAFTTFSTLTVDAWRLAEAGARLAVGMAVAYVASSVIVGFAGAAVGLAL